MLSHRVPGRRRDRGLALPIFAIVLVVLLVFVAFAVDLGAAWVEKRNDQNAADSGALAGAVEISELTSITAQAVVDEVMDAVESTLERDIPDADWANASLCPGEPPSGFTRIAGAGLGSTTPDTNCISISNSGSELRVRVPTQETSTYFASVVGVDEISTNAVAQALIALPTVSQTPPFVVPTGTNSGFDVCLRAGGSSGPFDNLPVLPYDNDDDGVVDDVDPCDNDATSLGSGEFGTISPTSYVINPCSTSSGVIEIAIADGIDHQLSRFPHEYTPPDALERQDGSGCNATPPRPLFPNTMRVDTGLDTGQLTCGLVGRTGAGCTATGPSYGSTTYTARLRRGSYITSTYTFGGRPIDSAPLWTFLTTNSSAPAECAPSGFSTGTFAQKMTLLHTCLRTWQDADGPIFADTILESSRFSFLPQIDETAVGSAPSCITGGGRCVHFEEFVPAYFHRLYTVVNGNARRGACDNEDPGNGSRVAIQAVGDGENDCGQANASVDRLGGLVFDCDMLPEAICQNRPPVTSGPGGDPQFEIFLSK